jgi:RHS repeat-associated protein
LLAVCVCVAAALSASAQNVQFTQGSVGAGLDNSIQIPIAAYPGRGAASLPVTLYYSSSVWRIGYRKTVHLTNSSPRSVAEAIYAEHSTSGWTTSLDIPKVEWPKLNDLYLYNGKTYHASNPPLTYRVANVFIHMPDGSTHELRKMDQVYADNGTVDKLGTFYAVDGSRLRYDSTGETTGTLYMSDGSRYVLNGADAQFIDRNGNALSYSGSTRQWTDTLGSLRGNISMPWPASPQAGVDYSYTPPGLTSPYIFRWSRLSDVLTPDAGGQTPALKAMSSHYLPQPGQDPTDQSGNNFPQPSGMASLFFSDYGDEFADNPELTYTNVVGRGQAQGQVFDPVVLAEVVLPTSTTGNVISYKFSYNIYGEIDKIIYPTGGYERSQYDTVAAMGNIKPPYTEGSRGVTFRYVSPDGTAAGELPPWKYEASSSLVKVTAPDNTYTESYRHNFFDVSGKTFGYTDARNGLTYDERSFDSSGVMLRRTLTEWTQTSASYTGPAPCCSIQPITYTAYRNPRPAKSVSLILDTGGAAQAKKMTYQYAAADPNNASTIEMTTGLDRTGMTESHFADGIDQTTAKTGTIDTISNNYFFPPASSYQTVYVPDQSYRSRNILGLISSVVLKDAAGNPVSKTETFYDEAAFPLITYGDLVGDAGYVDPGGSTVRGNPTTVRRYVDLSLNSYLETHAQFDQCGNPVYFWNERASSPFTESNAVSKKDYSSSFKHAYLTQTTTIAPDPSGQHGSSAQFTSSTTYNAVTAQVLTATDANLQVTTFSYANDQGAQDPLNRLRKVTRPDGGWMKTDYNDVVGNLYAHTEAKLDATRSTHAYQFFDKLGRASRSFALESGLTFIVSEMQYDQMGRVSQTSNPIRTTVNGSGDASQAAYWVTADQPAFWTTNVYDALGRVRQATLPDSTTVTTSYTGVYTTVTDQAGKQRRQKADALGRIVRVDEPDASGSLGDFSSPVQPSFYEYDTLGNVVRINQGLTTQGSNPESAASYTQHRYFKYDALSRLTYERQAEQAGTISIATDPLTGNAAWSRHLSYDETVDSISYKGLLTSAEDARHVVTRLYYDQLSRSYQVTYTDGTPTVTSKYDQPRTDPVTNAAYVNKGRLTEMTTAATDSVPQTQQLYDYDLMGRAVRQRQVVDVNTYTLSYAYNLGGALTSETYPSGRTVSYGYDSAARLSSVTSGATTYASSITYKPFGGVESMALGNGTTYSMSYSDTRLQLQSISLTQGATTVQKYDYKYGAVNMLDGTVDETKNDGQIASIEGTIGTQKQWQQRFAYDSLGRLSEAGEYRGDNGQQSYLLNYDYDVYGNRYQKQSRNTNNPVSQSWVEDNAYSPTTNRFTSGLTYDDAGNVTTDSRFRQRAFQYNANDRQKQSSNTDGTNPVASVYDGAGHRVATKVNGVLTNVCVYDAAGDLVAEYSGSVSYAGTSYVMGDHQGSTRVVMSGNTVVSRHDYLPFGEDIPGTVGMRSTSQGYSQPDGVRQKYAGMEQDDSTNMSHTLWREFDNLSARWTAPDPYGGSMSVSSPQSFNRYTYVNNDPVNQTDPAGLMAASEGWSNVQNAWGGDPGFFDPHFGGPEAIGEAAIRFENYVNGHTSHKPVKRMPSDAPNRIPEGIGQSPFPALALTQNPGQTPGQGDDPEPSIEDLGPPVKIDSFMYPSRADYIAALRKIFGYARTADFYQGEVDFPIDPAFPFIGIAVQGSVDRYGRFYFGAGGYVGIPGGNATLGYLTKPNSPLPNPTAPSEDEMKDFMKDFGVGFAYATEDGYATGVTVSKTKKGIRGAYQAGAGTPGGALSVVNTTDVFQIKPLRSVLDH